jgi:hypothetical protein
MLCVLTKIKNISRGENIYIFPGWVALSVQVISKGPCFQAARGRRRGE